MIMTTNLLDKDLVDDDNHNGDDTNLLDKAPGDLSPAEVSCSARENFPPMALSSFLSSPGTFLDEMYLFCFFFVLVFLGS